ncbi:hypothetical protein LWI29_027367 [Acer saccharum]|uniref:Xylanase inhibitor N-terminal domain-containing protein n=1 Tax=Acer saccharum TaxID=4024 RepID=A0AA39RJG5_ACESA|nr:hypothetical protein LWI29_027367 [Acer saccharum]
MTIQGWNRFIETGFHHPPNCSITAAVSLHACEGTSKGWLQLHNSSLPPEVMSWCYNQDDPVFNPTTSTSASYTVVPCGSPACDALLLNDRRCHAGKCGYKVNYADVSYTKGTLMLETLTFGQMRIQNMAMGCGHNNHG